MKDFTIPHPTVLTGETVQLFPLEASHQDALYEVASDPVLWTHIPVNGSVRENFDQLIGQALQERAAGRQYPFVIFHQPTQRLIGSTRFIDIEPRDRKLEIGFTYIMREYWGTNINFECKLLLMTYAFETLEAIRVQLKTKDTNIRSRTAIEKIGGKFEGILRKDRMQENGISRNSAYFSILDEEWPEARAKILAQMAERIG